MLLVGTLAGVSAVIKDYPIYGGQALRYGAAALILLTVASASRRPSTRLTLRDVLLLVAQAAVGLVLFNVCVIEATRHASPAMVGTVIGCVPVALAVAGPVLIGTADGRRRPSARVVAAGCVVVAGAALTTGLGTGSPRGLLLAAGALACEMAFSLLAMPLLPRLGPIRVSAYAAAAAAPMALLIGATVDGRAVLRVPTTAELAALSYLAIVISAAFLLWYSALTRLGPDRAGLFAGVVPIGAILTTVALGIGRPTAVDLAATMLVIVGILVGMSRGRRTAMPALALATTRPAYSAARPT
jgi:drug/metabolite transporter (DMT)-like permease